jgi:hypothetical protein
MKISLNGLGFDIFREQTVDFGIVAVLIAYFLAFRYKEYNSIKIAFVLTLLTILLPVLFYPFAVCWFALGGILGTLSSAKQLYFIFLYSLFP